MFVKTLFNEYGQFGLECKSFGCRWIRIDPEGNETDYDMERSGAMVLIILLIIMIVLNVATYVKVRVI